MLTAVLFPEAQEGQPPACVPTDNWKNRMWCRHTMEYYSAITKARNKVIYCVARTGGDDQLRKMSHALKDKYHMMLLTCAI